MAHSAKSRWSTGGPLSGVKLLFDGLGQHRDQAVLSRSQLALTFRLFGERYLLAAARPLLSDGDLVINRGRITEISDEKRYPPRLP